MAQVDEVLQYICNGFIHDTQKTGEEYTEEERGEIFESAVKLIYRCLFLFYAEARRLLPSDPDKYELYQSHSIQTICNEARKFRWGNRQDTDQYDLWKHLKGLVDAVNEGDPEYGIMGYNGGLFDDQEEPFLGQHQLRNDFLSRALYLLAFVEPLDNEAKQEYAIPYEDLEVRHLGELYENILEYTVQLADADRYRRRSKKGISILLASQTNKQTGDTLIKKGDVYFGESALERKQTGSYYTPESLVHFLNEKTIVKPLLEIFEKNYRQRFSELLQQAKSGHDSETQRGAAQSAAALVEQFVEEQVLNFKVCDPAMGSGHFLVDATNQMTRLVVALLEEIPAVEGANTSISSYPNEWRRQITRHCIYGVDLNPLAVTLAKLSLWLNCFASEHKLTFLDYHIRHGNSLIGIRSLEQLASIPKRKKDPKKKSQSKAQLSFPFSDFTGVLGEAASEVSRITGIDEDDTDTQKAILEHALESMADLRPLADLYTAYLMDPTIQYDDYKDLFERLAKGMSISDTLNFNLPVILEKIEKHKTVHNYHHWPLEFPDVFGPNEVGGFSATVGNPPWDIVKPNSQEFFSTYDPNFRSYKKQEANRISNELMAVNPTVAERWEKYCNDIGNQSSYFKEVLSYKAQGKGDVNTYKLFLEQFFRILTVEGQIGIVVPSGIYTDQGCLPLRQQFFEQSQIEYLYCFENRWPKVFSGVDGRFKFVLLGAEKGKVTNQFKCAFMQHDPDQLVVIDNNALRMGLNHVKKFSNQIELDIASRLYQTDYLVGDYFANNWETKFQREFHMTDDSPLFISNPETESHDMLPLLEGKQYWILSETFIKPTYYMQRQDAQIKRTSKNIRVVYRAVSASTNERTFVSTVIPREVPTGNTVNVCPLPAFSAMYVVAISSSFVWDWIVRQKVTTSLNTYIVNQLPFIDIEEADHKGIAACLVMRASRLICTTDTLAKPWEESYSELWGSSKFWYPGAAPIDSYGPVHEQEIRCNLRDEAKSITPEWGYHCGVHDRLSDWRDTGDRAQLRAEIDAYVAHLYDISRDDFSYILDTFPVLKKKEIKAFGEFMSKRKCLEEYDRIKIVLENSSGDSQ